MSFPALSVDPAATASSAADDGEDEDVDAAPFTPMASCRSAEEGEELSSPHTPAAECSCEDGEDEEEDDDEVVDEDAENACTTDEADEVARLEAAANMLPALPPLLPIRINFLSDATAAAPFCDVCDTTGDDIARLNSSFEG